MSKKPFAQVTVTLDRIIGGGQSIGTLDTGIKCLVWGGLPGETVIVQPTKKKSGYIEGYVVEVIQASPDRVDPRDDDSFLSTSPWQIVRFETENNLKYQLIEDAFELHKVKLPSPVDVWTDGREYEYRNKVEFSFWYDTERQSLDLAFFRRGTKSKIVIQGTSLALPIINKVAHAVLTSLRNLNVDGRHLKTLLVRTNRQDEVAWQLYVKDDSFDAKSFLANVDLSGVACAEVIYSDPRSPASTITRRLAKIGDRILRDSILGRSFHYATEGFFQINLPVYEQALVDMKKWIDEKDPVLDLYSGVGTIGLTIGGEKPTMVELNEHAVREMKRNIAEQGSNASAILAASEQALDFITNEATIVVDPPRAGLHDSVTERINGVKPAKVIYLSCNPVTQARDISKLEHNYNIAYNRGYNFFPRTPHIENLVILTRKT